MRARNWVFVATGAVVIVAAAVAAATLLDADTSDRQSRSIRGAGIVAEAPAGWHQPHPTDPMQLSLYTGAPSIGEDCTRRTDYTTVLLAVIPNTLPGPTPIRRPRHFNAKQGTGVETDAGDFVCGMTGQSIVFTENDQTWQAAVSFGRDVSPKRRAEAYQLLDSMRLPNPN